MLPENVWSPIKNYGITALANDLNISRHAIYQWNIRGRIPPTHVKNLMQLLDLELDQIAEAIWLDG
tara:strand:+ start:742 stop:939 length:198 start_codon:yes stop_codon:yes gene_type:complete